MVAILLFLAFWLVDTVWCVITIKRTIKRLSRRNTKIGDIFRFDSPLNMFDRLRLPVFLLGTFIYSITLVQVYYDLFAWRVGLHHAMNVKADIRMLIEVAIGLSFVTITLSFHNDDDDDDHRGGWKQTLRSIRNKMHAPRLPTRSPLPSPERINAFSPFSRRGFCKDSFP